jgi:hypothetical protein
LTEFDTDNKGYSELQPQSSTSDEQQQEQPYHRLCGQYGPFNLFTMQLASFGMKLAATDFFTICPQAQVAAHESPA